MKLGVILAGGLTLMGCSETGASRSNHQNLNVAECQALAQETFAAGKLNYDLCPGYQPDGQPIEIF